MKKSIIIDEKHAEKINEFLKEGQGRAKERTVKDFEELKDLIERYLSKLPTIPKKHLDKCILYIKVGAKKFPNRYKYIPYGTSLTIIFGQDGKGRLEEVERVNINDRKEYKFHLTETAKNSVLKQLNIE